MRRAGGGAGCGWAGKLGHLHLCGCRTYTLKTRWYTRTGHTADRGTDASEHSRTTLVDAGHPEKHK
eukprot:5976736-Pyramimonas_sp.AAC.2